MADRKRKNVTIAGIGEIGEQLAITFAKENHNVTLIDISGERLSSIDGQIDVSMCVGHAGDTEVLRRAGVANADLFIATSNKHEANVIAALKAKHLGARKTVALVEDVTYFEQPTGIYHNWLGLDLVLNTRFLIAHEIGKLIRTRGALAVEDFAENRTEMVQFRVDRETDYTERPLSELTLPRECLIVAIKRGHTLMIPRGDDSVHIGDQILVLGRIDKIPELEEAFGRGRAAGRKSVILGGGTVGYVLARSLGGIVPDVTLIEKDYARCEFLSRELDNVAVIHGDGTDVDLLQEEGVGSAEVFAAVSGEDEKNIIAARLAKELGTERCIALVSRPDYTEVCQHLGLEAVMSPRRIVTREVMRAMMPGGGLIGVTPVMGGIAEFVEIAATESSPVAGKSLKSAGFPRGSVVCALMSGSTYVIPHGETVIEPGMRAIVFTQAAIRSRVESLFRN